MNAASAIILIVVCVIIGLAIKATFFKKARKGGCCDVGDEPRRGSAEGGCAACSASSCSGCAGCGGAAAKNNLQPIYKPIK